MMVVYYTHPWGMEGWVDPVLRTRVMSHSACEQCVCLFHSLRYTANRQRHYQFTMSMTWQWPKTYLHISPLRWLSPNCAGMPYPCNDLSSHQKLLSLSSLLLQQTRVFECSWWGTTGTQSDIDKKLWRSGLSVRVPGCQKLQMTAWPGLAQDVL